MNRNKRGQSEIISTVLIILLVLAAIIIVWAVVTKIIGTGSKTVEEKMLCTEVALTFVPDLVICATDGTVSGTIKRGADSADKKDGTLGINMKIIVGNTAYAGVATGTTAPLSLGSTSFTGLAGGTPGSKVLVKVAAMVGADANIVCNPVPDGEITVDCPAAAP